MFNLENNSALGVLVTVDSLVAYKSKINIQLVNFSLENLILVPAEGSEIWDRGFKRIGIEGVLKENNIQSESMHIKVAFDISYS